MKTERKGYNEEFLGKSHPLPLPKIDLEYEKQILENPSFRENYIVDYVHYSLVMNARTRQAFYSAANVDQKKLNDKVSARNWFIDSRVGEENQVGPEAYDRNEWDRGHLTRRADITWGNEYEAKMGSNDSCSYANACMQHENFNQDEWTVPEEVILNLDKTANGKICVFTGPVFTKIDRWYNRSGLADPVRIPSAFWKVAAYVDKETDKIACQAYLMYQDNLFCADKRGHLSIRLHNYQVTITEIESLTGIVFPEELFHANPLYFYERENINDGPEAYVAPKRKHQDMNEGVIFSRADTEKPHFKKRKRILSREKFENYLKFYKD